MTHTMKTTDICKEGTKFKVDNFFNVYIYQDITTKHWSIEVHSDDWEFTLNQCDLTKKEALDMALGLSRLNQV